MGTQNNYWEEVYVNVILLRMFFWNVIDNPLGPRDPITLSDDDWGE